MTAIPTSNVFAEPLLWRISQSGRPYADLLLSPRRLRRVYRANHAGDFPLEGFSIEGRRIFAHSPGSLPTFGFDELYPVHSGCRFGRYRDGLRYVRHEEGHYFHDRQVCVDYETNEIWKCPAPAAEALPFLGLKQKFRGEKSVRVALIGDSISCGANASGEMGVVPFQSAWQQLCVEHLGKVAGGGIEFRNFSKGGMNARWGREQALTVSEFAPQLLMVAFGMNDLSEGRAVADFEEDVQSLISCIRRASPETRFLLISGMAPNPDWSLDFPEERQAAHERLASLTQENVVFCDVRSFWNTVVARKGFWSLTGNGVNHPNDFGHRLYADCVLASLGYSTNLMLSNGV